MIRSILPLTIIVFLASCAAQKNNVLSWPVDAGKVTTYQGIIGKFPSGASLSTNAAELSQHIVANSKSHDKTISDIPSLYFEVVDELVAIPLPGDMPLVATITSNSANDLEVKLVGAPALLDVEPQTEQAVAKLKIREAKAGTIQLLAHMDSRGNVLSSYHFQKQKNLVSLFFQLPNKPVKVGDTWDIPVQFIELGNGYVVDETQNFKRAILLSKSTNKQGEVIAKILFVVHEFVKGQFQFKDGATLSAVPFSLDAGYIGYGELVVNRGYWARHVGQVAYVGTGQSPMNVKKLHALVYKN